MNNPSLIESPEPKPWPPKTFWRKRATLALAALGLASAMSGLADDESNRVWIVGLTNGSVLSGELQFPIKFVVTNQDIITGKDIITGISVHGTNGPIPGAGADSLADYRLWMSRFGTNGPLAAEVAGTNEGWILSWNTQMSANGPYTIEAELDFDIAPSVVSEPVTVTVSNLFAFPDPVSQMFGSRMWIYTQTLPDAKVEIDMFNETNGYVGSFFPTSDTNGIISFLWNLTDGNGHTFTNHNFRGAFTILSLSNAPAVWPSVKSSTMPPFLKIQQKPQKSAIPSTASATQSWGK